ncbi:MAG: phosphotransferase [Caldilineaceae bacterium]|nr:phosphotransferase [Caldilineaceae bacterium]
MTAIALDEAEEFLRTRFGSGVNGVQEIGAGAWSRCFGFTHDGRALAIRFGGYVDDFEKDRFAGRFHSPALPIPQVSEIGEAPGGYYAVSTRAYGSPLEQMGRTEWTAVARLAADVLEAMRTADLSGTSGWGGWNGDGQAQLRGWSQHLLAVDADTPDRRTFGWREKLTARPALDDLFRRGYARLRQVASDDVPRSLIHSDLMNRNVLASARPGGQAEIGGIFDWGCGLYGDHLYDLAWFDYWSPWHPGIDTALLWAESRERWHRAGYAPENLPDRLAACYLQIGLDHFAYNAWLEDWPTLEATARRMIELVPLE